MTKTDEVTETVTQPAVSVQPLILGLWQRGNERTELDSCFALHEARTAGYDYVTTIIPTIEETTRANGNNNRIRNDLTTLPSQWWKTSVVGVVSTPTTNDSSIECSVNNDVSLIPMDTTESTTAELSTSIRTGFLKLDNRFENHLRSSLEWAIHVNLPAIILPDITLMTRSDVERFAGIVNRTINGRTMTHSQQLWVPVPLSSSGLQKWIQFTMYLCRNNGSTGLPIYALLSLPKNSDMLPPTNSDAGVPSRRSNTNFLVLVHAFVGCGYPIAAVQLLTQEFLINKKGFPTLSKFHQTILSILLKRIGRTVRTLLVHDVKITNGSPIGNIPLLHFQQYLQHYRKSRSEIVSTLDTDYAANKEIDYLDQLQQPLQPLKDHLENTTYEVFEQDPVKYKQYQIAVQCCLEDILISKQQNLQQLQKGDNCITIMVVGAGRGPLVTACCAAYRQITVTIRQQQLQQPHLVLPNVVVYAVEKNPSAVLYLNSMLHNSKQSQHHAWSGIEVHVVHEDLRQLSSRKHTHNRTADVIVSELLGSFGCNELSPECLDDLLYNTDVCTTETISIPCSYTSYLAPVSSTKLHQQVCQQSLFPNTSSTACIGYRQAVETPYVVRPHAASQMHIEVPCWSFEHGRRTSSADTSCSKGKSKAASRERSVQVSFTSGNSTNPSYAVSSGCGYNPIDNQVQALLRALQQQQGEHTEALPCWILNGFLGTFTALLYSSSRTKQSVLFSTAPNHDFSVGMFSWFPLYFPLHDPILVPTDTIVQASIDRKCCIETSRVWYEWSVQVVDMKSTVASFGGQHGTVGAVFTDASKTDGERTGHDPEDVQRILYVSPVHNPGGRSYHVAM